MLNDIYTEVLYVNRKGTYENGLILVQYNILTEQAPQGEAMRERIAALMGWKPEETTLEACFPDAPRNYNKEDGKAAIYRLCDGLPHGLRRIRLF